MTFEEIFAQYWSLFRGQATSIPAFGDREFTVGIHRCNNAIRKWDRADGTLWKELLTTAVLESEADIDIFPAAASTLVANTLSYPAPTNMRKPPARVWFYKAGSYFEIPVVDPRNISGLNELGNYVTFLGSAEQGYTMYTNVTTSVTFDTWQIDYLYIKKPTFLTVDTDPSAQILNMSDPNFAINDMLCSAFASTRNGFGFKVAQDARQQSLVSMKIEDSSGTWGTGDRMKLDLGWGVNTPVRDIRL